MKRAVLHNFKNVFGWRTTEKLVVFSVDDYGNVRLDSPAARNALTAAGLDMSGRFDQFDALETKQDLELLFDVLSSVRDSVGRMACFTPYTLCANPDFDSIANGSGSYEYMTLPQTFAFLSESQPQSYIGAWELWQDGIRQGLLRPQFHGREHLNVQVIESKLRSGDWACQKNIENFSMAGIGNDNVLSGVKFSEAFRVLDDSDIVRHREIIDDGLRLFREIFGYSSTTFTPPGLSIHPALYLELEKYGVRGIDKPRRCKRQLSKDRQVWEVNFLGPDRKHNHVSIVRNVAFEPTRDASVDASALALDQIEVAFRWGKPALISSHRVNYCGHIATENRKVGLAALGRLLDGIVSRWPDVRFITADELVQKIEESN